MALQSDVLTSLAVVCCILVPFEVEHSVSLKSNFSSGLTEWCSDQLGCAMLYSSPFWSWTLCKLEIKLLNCYLLFINLLCFQHQKYSFSILRPPVFLSYSCLEENISDLSNAETTTATTKTNFGSHKGKTKWRVLLKANHEQNNTWHRQFCFTHWE